MASLTSLLYLLFLQSYSSDPKPPQDTIQQYDSSIETDAPVFDIYWSCEEGQIRGPDGRCKLPDSETNSMEGGLRCPVNEHFSLCDGYCQKGCRNREIGCSKVCVWGCVCDEGMVRGPEGKCIPIHQCPPEKEAKTTPVDVQDNSHGCPVKRKCDEYCKATFPHTYGVCVGRRLTLCECRRQSHL